METTATSIKETMKTSLPFMTGELPETMTEAEAIRQAEAFMLEKPTFETPKFALFMNHLMMCGCHDKASELIEAATRNDAAKNRVRLTEKYHLAPDVSDDDISKLNSYDKKAAMCSANCIGDICRKPPFADKNEECLIEIVNGYPFFRRIKCRRMLAFQDEKRLKNLYKKSQVPVKRRNLQLSDLIINDDNREAYSLAKQAIEDGKTSLFIHGSFGVGKTTLASIIANESLKRNRQVIYSAVPKLLTDIKSTFDSKASQVKTLQYGEDLHITETKSTSSEMLQAITKVPVLILDDLGMEAVTDWTVKQLSMIINERYDNERQTIITSNFSGNKLANHLSQQVGGKYPFNSSAAQKRSIDEMRAFDSHRIMNRIMEMCEFVEIKCKNWRLLRKAVI